MGEEKLRPAALRGRTPLGRRAFSLLEILLVVLLIGVLAVAVWPDFHSTQRSAQLDESARRVKAVIAMARAQAMNEARIYRLSFRADGSLRLSRQRDALAAPDEFRSVREAWNVQRLLLDDVWVAELLPLPSGPPPIDVSDDVIEFEKLKEGPAPITDFVEEYHLDFRPDGQSNSARWILRDPQGRGAMQTLDGRLGRLTMEPVARLAQDEVSRPPALKQDPEEEPEDDRK